MALGLKGGSNASSLGALSSSALLQKRWAQYVLKSAAVILGLFIVSLIVPKLPAWAAAIVWALLSLVPATGAAYHVVISKTYKQTKFQEGSRLGALNRGRVLCLVVSFAASAACMASMLVESPKWGVAMWVMAILAIPLYLGVSHLVGRFLRHEYAPLLQRSYIAIWSAAITAVLLGAVYAIALFLMPHASYGCAADAFMAAPKPFEGSPSALLAEAGDMAALVDGLSAYALSKAAEASFEAYVVWQIVLSFGAFLGITSLLAVCSIEPNELRRVFVKLEKSDADKAADGDAAADEAAVPVVSPDTKASAKPTAKTSAKPLLKRYVAVSIVLPLILIAGFAYADTRASEITNTREYTAAQDFIRQQVSFVVYQYDGKYYNPEVVDDLLANARAQSEELAKEMEETLVPLINASFDARIENVDAYLDWYYSLFADWEQLFNWVQGNAEEFAEQQFEARIEEGIDDTELNAAYDGFLQRAQDLREDTLEELAQYEITAEYPDWLVTRVEPLDEQLSTSLEPSQKFLEANERIGISVATGVVAGIIAKKLVKRVAGKAVFKAVVSRIATVAGMSATAAAGGPAVFAVGVVASLATDVAQLKADELMNRESYREELVAAIEEQREEMLSTVRAWSEVTAPAS